MPLPGKEIGEFSALEQWQIEEIKKGLDEADRGEFASDEEVEQALKRWMLRRRFYAMKQAVIVATMFCALAGNMASQPNPASSKKESSTDPKRPSSITFENSGVTNNYAEQTKSEPPKWYAPLQRPDWWLVIIAALTGAAIAYQAKEMTRATEVMRDQLTNTRETSERQLRAYVVAELGSIVNVADPIPAVGLEPTEARRKFQWGPVARIQIKNTGQTPAFKVEHWGNLCFREYPLTSELPPPAKGLEKSLSIIGPGIINTKTLSIGPVLTDEQVAELRVPSAAIYFYGEVCYEDAFGKRHFTRYRVLHNQTSGPVGVSTDFTFAAEGNEAD